VRKFTSTKEVAIDERKPKILEGSKEMSIIGFAKDYETILRTAIFVFVVDSLRSCPDDKDRYQ
jgi:hypothetical protein